MSEAAGPAVGGSAVQDKVRGSSSWQCWTSQHDKDILALALPAALALAADPLLGMVDTALIGRLGADELVSVLQSKRGAQMQRSCVPGAWFPCCTHAHFVALLGICWASHLLAWLAQQHADGHHVGQEQLGGAHCHQGPACSFFTCACDLCRLPWA